MRRHPLKCTNFLMVEFLELVNTKELVNNGCVCYSVHCSSVKLSVLDSFVWIVS